MSNIHTAKYKTITFTNENSLTKNLVLTEIHLWSINF